MKKICLSLLIILMCVTLTGFAADTKYVSKITVLESSIRIDKGEEAQIEYKVLPVDADNTDVEFETSNKSVATVDEDGVVYGKNTGSAKITILSADGKAKAYVTVRVIGSDDDDEDTYEYQVRSIAITKDNKIVNKKLNIMATEKLSLGVKIYPSSANSNVRWRSDDEDIAEVDENGVVTAQKEGTCKIYVSSKSNSAKKDYIVIEVTPFIKYPDSISIAPEEGAVFETGKKIKFSAVLSPDITTERLVRWSVQGSCGVIDSSGVLTITDKGKITVKAYSADYKKSAEYSFESKYSADHFALAGTAENVLSKRAIVMTFDTDVNILSATNSIKAYCDELCNGEEIPVSIETIGNKVVVKPAAEWNIGENYIAIKGSLMDIYGNKINKNIKYKVNVRGNEKW